VPITIARPEYVDKPAPARNTEPTYVQTPEVIEAMRVASRIAAQALQEGGQAVKPGATTDDVDAVVHEFLLDHGAYPSTLGYRNFPKSCCTSLNEVICHGIPDSTLIEDGDIVNIDVTAFIGGVHGDTNATFFAGEVSDEARLLVERTHEATMRAIKAVRPGRALNVIGRVIEAYAKRFGYGVVRDFTGHGIGRSFHSGLVILHYDEPTVTTEIQTGMTFTIEPMITLGGIDYDMWADNWTVTTKDKKWTAQFEHTIVVTDTGAEILTLP
jgi:methionyl aminopeptidase